MLLWLMNLDFAGGGTVAPDEPFPGSAFNKPMRGNISRVISTTLLGALGLGR